MCSLLIALVLITLSAILTPLSGQQTIGILPLNEQIFNLFLCSRNKSQFCGSTQMPSDLVNGDTHLSLNLSSNEVEAKLAAKNKLRRRKIFNTSIDDVFFRNVRRIEQLKWQ